jgi:hypothetical protein
MHCRQATRPRATKEPQQERLGLIVACVAQRDNISGKVRARSGEKLMTRTAGSVLDRVSFAAGTRTDVLAPDKTRPAKYGSGGLAKLFVAIGILAQLMIEMSDARNDQLARLFKGPQQVRERDRIAAA